jgi:hypothetical protein
VEPQPRALPAPDLEAIFGVLVTVHGHLSADELPPDLVRHLLSRLARHGPLPDGASAGELNALLADLCERMHWAMSDDYGDYPQPMPRRTTYYLDVPDEEADACMAALTELGGEVSRSGTGSLAAAFPDLPPDPGHHARVAQLSSLAHRHGGEFAGFGG